MLCATENICMCKTHWLTKVNQSLQNSAGKILALTWNCACPLQNAYCNFSTISVLGPAVVHLMNQKCIAVEKHWCTSNISTSL